MHGGDVTWSRSIGTPQSATLALASGQPVPRFIKATKGKKAPNIYRTTAVEVLGRGGMDHPVMLGMPGSETLYQYGAKSLASNKANINPNKPSTQVRHDYANQQLRIANKVEPGGYQQVRAGEKYGRAKLAGKETHHVTEVNTGGRILNALPNTASKERVVRQAMSDGIYFSDDRRNQSWLYGSGKNIPGGSNIEMPKTYTGLDEHDGVHQTVRVLAEDYGLPDPRKQTGDTIETRMAGTKTTLGKELMALAMFQLGRLGLQKHQFTKGGQQGPLTARQANALKKSEQKVQGLVNDVAAEDFYAGFMDKVGLPL